MTRRSIIQGSIFLAAVSWCTAATDQCHESSQIEDRIDIMMREMRVVASILEDQRRIHGAYPAADGLFHPLSEALPPGVAGRVKFTVKDIWGRPLRYRADTRTYQLISYGSDGIPDEDYARQRLYSSQHAPVIDSPVPAGDLVLLGGRFVRRPFLNDVREIATLNAINAIYTAAASFAVDYNRYPGDATVFSPVTDLLVDLVPIYIADLPEIDGWGRPLLYANARGALWLVSFGEDGQRDRAYEIDPPCGLHSFEATSVISGGDTIQTCGVLSAWPAGAEP